MRWQSSSEPARAVPDKYILDEAALTLGSKAPPILIEGYNISAWVGRRLRIARNSVVGFHQTRCALPFARRGGRFVLMAKMRAVQVPQAKQPLEIVERDIPEPQPGWVRVKVEACGVCHSDSLTKEGLWPGIQYPRVPGHEVIGVIDQVGPNVSNWTTGQRVGVGWHGSHCGHCDRCRRGDFFACQVELLTTGISFDGGYAEYMLAPAKALALVPDDLSSVDSAPLMCAGLTTFNALRNSGARPGDVVGVLGIGGLGHLGVQYAAKMGFRAVAIGRGKDKEPLARKLGARHYVDSEGADPAAELNKLGGASVILATATNGDAMAAVIGGLAPRGVLMVIGAGGPITVNPLLLISGQRSLQGWYSGTSIDSQDTLEFSSATGVQSMNEVYPLEQAADAYDRMMSGKARFRVVLDMAGQS
jgi:D-arabinose 1-dehydrogenase-like Zn-dependent alcohol dehydrogenase